MMIKLDLNKAFDSLSWNFITKMLSSYNFPEKIIKIINSCLKNTT